MEERIQNIRELRKEYGISQKKFAQILGIDRSNLTNIENGRRTASSELLGQMEQALDRYNPDKQMEILFDYVRIRFPTRNERIIIEDVMGIHLRYMAEEPHAFYGYGFQYFLGDIVVMVSPDREKGILLELKGKGCRQFEAYLEAQKRTWFDFFRAAEKEGAVWKRIDIAINDRSGILDIPELAEKCRKDECVSIFRSFKDYQSGLLVHAREEDAETMGNTLYLGSLRSEIYFCIYEKDYEQYVKNGTPLEEAETKNRFEIRLKNSRAEHAINELLKHEDVADTAFSVINHYVRFVDCDENKKRRSWDLNERWQWFIGEQNGNLRLTTRPEPYTLERAAAWLVRQVAPTLKMFQEMDEMRHTEFLSEMLAAAKLSRQHQKILEQQRVSLKQMVV